RRRAGGVPARAAGHRPGARRRFSVRSDLRQRQPDAPEGAGRGGPAAGAGVPPPDVGRPGRLRATMAKRTTTRRRGREDAFRHKLVLNAFLIREFGIDPLRDHTDTDGRAVPPIRRLSAPIRTTPEGLDDDGLHRFYHAFKA